jgi:hypothetical protein
LTHDGVSERRSVLHNVPQQIANFTALFTYQAINARRSNGIGCGATFTFQNSAAGPRAAGGSASGLGYSGISPSAAITLEMRPGGDARSGHYLNGFLAGGSAGTDPVDFFDTNPIEVTIDYDGSQLATSFVDTVTGESFSGAYPVDLCEELESDTAYDGFTASTGAFGWSANANQRVTNFMFAPEPETWTLLAIGITVFSACLMRRRKSCRTWRQRNNFAASLPRRRRSAH